MMQQLYHNRENSACREGDQMKLSASIFDMDGVLLDSEPYWRQAEKEIFASIGIMLTEQDCIDTMGIRIDEIVLMRCAQTPEKYPPAAETVERIVQRVAELIRLHAQPLPGAHQALQYFVDHQVPLGLASSSSYFLIDTTLEALNMRRYFQVCYSAEREPFGKPHPAVYLSAAQKMGVPPIEILAIEDSFSGVIAAKAAKMTVAAIPEASVRLQKRFAAADVMLNSLEELPSYWESCHNGLLTKSLT